MLTPETLIFLRSILDRITLPVSDEHFTANALSIITAINELDAAIKGVDTNAFDPFSPALHDERLP